MPKPNPEQKREMKKYRVIRRETKTAGEPSPPRGSAFSVLAFLRAHRALLLLVLFLAASAVFVVCSLATPVRLLASIDGQVLGAVESNVAVDQTILELEDEVSDLVGRSFRFAFTVRYSFGGNAPLLTREEIKQKLYAYLPSYMTTGAALYVDGVQVAVCEKESTIRQELKEITRLNAGEGEDVGILNEVRVVTQPCRLESIMDREQLRALLENMAVPPEEREVPAPQSTDVTAVPGLPEQHESAAPGAILLCDGTLFADAGTEEKRPGDVSGIYLAFYRSEVLQYRENVSFPIEYTESDDLYTSMTEITTPGVPGQNDVEARVYYVKDKEARREILSEKVVKEAETQVVSVGTRILPEELGVSGVKGRFILPRCAAVSSFYGQREMGFHQGWDIPGPVGAGIYASASGRVVTAIGQDGGFTYNPGTGYAGYGYCVVIDHGNGYSTLYAHCDRIDVVLGQEVKQGDKIGEVGETGDAYGAHVHFEILRGSEKLDPGSGYMYTGKATVYDTRVSASNSKVKKDSARQVLLEK